MIEIERKFLVTSFDFKDIALKKTRIAQGYLNTAPERTVRVRIKGEKAFITVKGISNASGTSRFEWEKEILISDAEMLLPLCEQEIIEKFRYEIPYGSHLIEVDEFMGKNKGLIVAEIELKSENESFARPDWLGLEVTGKQQYYNSKLSKKPYNLW